LNISRVQDESSGDHVDLCTLHHAANSLTRRLADDTLIKLRSTGAASIRSRLSAIITKPVTPNELQHSIRSFDQFLSLRDTMADYTLSLDGIGWTYITIFIVWNLLLLAGVIFLWTHRQHPSLRMRRLPLLFAGIAVLHIYGSLCSLAYPFGAAFDCSVEFWMMYVPMHVRNVPKANNA
jgi:hypothetical protein